MRRFVQVFAWALSAAIVGGVIASASPGRQSGPKDDPSPVVSLVPVATGTEAPDTESDGSSGPDFSACEGLKGLENAICRHEALLAIHPDDQGLANSLGHLQENLSKHDDGNRASASHGHSDEPHGQSDEPHGNGNGGGNGHGG